MASSLRRLFPSVLLTDREGPSQRLRVDPGQTGWFAGREFRALREFNLGAAGVRVFKLVFPVDTIVWGIGVGLLSGEIRLENVSAGTEGGTFSESLLVIPRNAMTERPSPNYVAQNTILTGGTYTGGTVTDVLMLKTADNSNFANTVGAGQEDERGAPPGTYFIRVTAVSAAVGVVKIRWEERV